MSLNLTTKRGSSKNLTNHYHLDKIKTEARDRRRTILHLILSYLKENFLENTAEALVKETQLDTSYQLCENVELDVVLQEYQSYYYTKFQKYPKMVRRVEDQEKGQKKVKSNKRLISNSVKDSSVIQLEEDPDFQFNVIPLNLVINRSNSVDNNLTKTSWSDCLGLEAAIETLKEALIYPMLYPEVFKDLTPWKGVLLHGPPGTGKTLLAKALACESGCSFFNVTSSEFTSKWRGDSEKLIKDLFDNAKLQSPSTIFFDEIDALMAGTKEIHHEASKRFQSELLTLLDGVVPNEGQILILASTNSPWDLDGALLRRFDKRVLVDMPSKEYRQKILRHHLRNLQCVLSPEEIEEIGKVSEGYTGSDLKIAAKEVAMILARERMKIVEKGEKKNLKARQVTYKDICDALQKIRPSANSSTCKRYYQWQNLHGAA
ncbi:katanin p60 ATPase-containing subunit A-like 2 [Euwallacea fornicatus]|uniref:katanin p60 ATPase-containing subunit A-like 2 n=1 Tax=Euwallacea fornicatus TaxID=995702 RepID=UPI00338E757A